jgi:hypothetical protein
VSWIFVELPARFDINIVTFTNITQKEEAVPELQALEILGPDGLPNTEKFQWKTIPQGAATTVAAAFDPRISGTCLLSLVASSAYVFRRRQARIVPCRFDRGKRVYCPAQL